MKNKTQKRKLRISKLAIQTTILLAVLILAYDLSGIGGNIKFYSKLIECGQKPLEIGATKGGPPYYRESPILSIYRGPQTYFCTPLEAEREGYSANAKRYDFPHLTAAGEESPILKERREERQLREREINQ